MILSSLKMYGRIVVKLKSIKYKIDITCYLSFLFSDLAIMASYQDYWFVPTITECSCYRVPCHQPNIAILHGFYLLL